MVIQKKAVAKLISEYPDLEELYEYEDYAEKPTRGNAVEFIARAAEAHPELIGSMGGYVSYIATRPGAAASSGHGLFSDAGSPVVLEQAAEEVKNHEGNVWCHIISLRRVDAERLGYADADAWRGLLRGERNTVAKAMKIVPENFRWYAAFHNESHHPHVHMVCYSKDPGEPWLTEAGIVDMKSALARKIFRGDLLHVYKKQTEYRDELRASAAERARRMASEMEAGASPDPKIEKLLFILARKLKNTSGKKIYGYLSRDTKAFVDMIVDEIAKDKYIDALYGLWYEQREEVIKTYTDQMPDRIPLSQNKEFKTIKSAVIREALALSYQEAASEMQMGAIEGSMRILLQAGRVIEDAVKAESKTGGIGQTEGKLWREINEKKQSQGLRL